MKKFQLPRFKDHVGLGETPKYKSYLLRLHEEDANNDEEEIFESKPRELCVERRVLPHPKKRMQLFMEDDEKRQLERNEVINSSSNNNNNNNTCSQIQCPSDVATAHIAFPVDRLDNMRQIAPHQYPQSLSQIPGNHANFATSNCDLDSLKQRKFQKEFKVRNGFGAGYASSPFPSHPICSAKHPPPFVSRHRPGHYYSKGKSIGNNIIEDRSSLQNTSGGDPCIDNTSHHSMNLPYLNPWMFPEHNVHQPNNEQEEKLLVGIQYDHKMFDDFILNKKEHHSLASPNAQISPDLHSEYILPQQQRHDEEISVLSDSSSFCARGVNSAEDLRLPNSSRRLAQIINEVSCGKQAVLRQLVPLKAARQPAGDPAFRRRSGFHEQDFWQNEHRKDAVHLPCDADFGGDVHPHGLFPQCPGVPVTRHGDDVAIYPSHPPQHYGYGPPQQYMYEREDLQTNPTPAGTTAPSLSARDKTISWLSSGDSSSFTPYKPADAITSPTSHNTSSAKKSDDYRGRPMSTWEFRHVAHFLIEATHDLGIQYEDTDFSQLSKVNGQKLISMGPEHYEKFAPTQGQRIFDYVRRHRNHEVLTDGALDTCTESSPDVSSMRSIETPPVSFCAPTWTTVSDEAYSYYPPADTFPVENSFSNVKNQSSPPSSKVPSPYAPMSVDTSLPTTSTFSDPFQFMEGSCSSDSAAKQESHLVPTSLSTPYSTQSLMNSGSLLPPASVESTTSYHSQMLRPPKSSNGSQQDKSGLNDTIRPSSSMSAATSEIEESSDDDDDDGEGDDEEEEEEEEVEEKVVEEKPPEPPKKRGPGRPPKPESERKKKKKTGRLWEFIRNLLLNPETCPSIVKWEDSETGVFRFVQSEKVAERWGMRKNNKKMNYEKLSRAMRYYYKGKVFEPVLGRRLVYKFGVNAKGWKPNEGNFGE